MAGKVSITKSEERKLHTKCGNRCAICKAELVDTLKPNAPCIGENAHIYGEKPGAARYDATKEASFVNSERNLIFLCCNCHKKIDTDVDAYPPDYLFQIKSKHERWVVNSMMEKSANYTFAELEVLVSYLVSQPGDFINTSSYVLLKIGEKIKRNSLEDVQQYINIGLINSNVIEDYLNRNPDPLYAARLTSIMAKKYIELRSSLSDNIDIFYELWDFACGGNQEFQFRAAGLGILTYFFEKCEVFEK